MNCVIVIEKMGTEPQGKIMFSEASVSHSVHLGYDVTSCRWPHILSEGVYLLGESPTRGVSAGDPLVVTSTGANCSGR